MKPEISLEHFWDTPLRELLHLLEATPAGLTSDEANRRLRLYGPNSLVQESRFAALFSFLRLVANPLVIILLIASGASLALGDRIGGLIIISIVLLSVLLNFFMEFQARHAVEKIQKQVATTAAAVRDGQEQELRIAELVPGDIIRLNAGDLVPADARLLKETDLQVRESALTGESLPVEKSADDLPAGKHGVADASNSVFLGTAVQTGIGTAVIVRTGRDTAFGEIAKRLAMQPPETEFARGIRHFGTDDHLDHDAAGAFRLAGKHHPPPSAAGVVPLFCRACRGDDAGDDADDHHSHTGPGRKAYDQEEGPRQATGGNRGLRQHRYSLQR